MRNCAIPGILDRRHRTERLICRYSEGPRFVLPPRDVHYATEGGGEEGYGLEFIYGPTQEGGVVDQRGKG